VPFLLSYILRYVSFTEVGSVYRVTFREPIHLCTSVIEEGDDGEGASSETPSQKMRSKIFKYFHCRVLHQRIVYYESIKRELKIKPIYECRCRCDERLQTKRFTRLAHKIFSTLPTVPGRTYFLFLFFKSFSFVGS